MKSSLFSKNDLMRGDRFVKDIKVLLDLPPHVIGELPKYALQALVTATDEQEGSVYDVAAANLGVPRAQLEHSIDLSKFFMTEFSSGGDAVSDEPANIVTDLENLVKFDKKLRTPLEQYFKEIKRIVKEKGEAVLLRKQHVGAGLAKVRSIESVVDYRLVFDKFLKEGQDVDAFSPECRGAIPLAIVELRFTKGDPERVVFQAEKRTIQLLINQLRAIEKQMDLGRLYLNLAEDTDNE